MRRYISEGTREQSAEKLLSWACQSIFQILQSRSRYYQSQGQNLRVSDPLLFKKLAMDSSEQLARFSDYSNRCSAERTMDDRTSDSAGSCDFRELRHCQKALENLRRSYSQQDSPHRNVPANAMAKTERRLAKAVESLLPYCQSEELRFLLAGICASAVMHADTLKESEDSVFRVNGV